MTMSLRSAAALVPASLVALTLVLAGCAELQPMPVDPAGRLFARALDQIDELYIVRVSNRILALGAADRLSALDPKLRLIETPAAQDRTELVLSYGSREIATYSSPSSDDPHTWASLLSRLEADAKRTSPTVASAPQDNIDKTMFDGITSGLDRFSRYSTPQVARDQRAARDGFGGIGILLEDDTQPYRITKVLPGSPADIAGIRVGDRLVSVDGQTTANRSQNEVVRQLRGAISSNVTVTIDHPGQGGRRSYRAAA